jgi:RNA polymerase primary sigma factor
LINKITKITNDLVQDTGREPAPHKVAERLNMPAERVINILKISKDPVSLESPIGEDDSHLMDFIEDKETRSSLDFAITVDLHEKLNNILCELQPHEEKIIRKRYGIGGINPHTLEELGREFDVTRERIRQIEVNAIKKLKYLSRQMAFTK